MAQEFKNRNHSLIQLALSALAALSLIFACTPENNNNGGESQNNPEELTITGDALDVTDCSATLTGYANLPFELGDAEVGIMYDKVKSFEAAKKVVATGLDGNNKFTVTATVLEPSTTFFFKSYVQNGMAVKYGAVKSFTTKESTIPAGSVDLGIVMTRTDGTTYKLYWAKSNLSDKGLCANPEDYGDYYAWGETESYYSSQSPLTWKNGKSAGYNPASYKWCNGSYNTLTKYNTKSFYGTVDNKTVLDAADDVASVKLGGKWRVPTDAEWTELMTKCTWTWTTNYNGTGVRGRIVTASNGNSIFLPAAGYRDDTHLDYAGSRGNYWSSSLYTDDPNYAWRVYFDSGNVSRYNYLRYYGPSVRPVSE